MVQIRDKLRLYAVLPENGEHVKLADQALKGGATAIQLRMKAVPDREFLRVARELRKVTEEYDALFVVDDRVDIAILADADGVHLGADDVSVADAKALDPGLIVGATVRDVEMAKSAVREGADYLGAGSVFPSRTKHAPVIGVEGIRDIVSAVKVPVVAIGGIDETNVVDVMRAGVAGVAVVCALFCRGDVENRAIVLRGLVDSALSR
uniref:Thiamine-phosphate synthase n=1 Tax=uncultured euryarchaeote Alv-FOS1 TaxID=337892 RepID=Q3SAA0_9EURY|nr:thiamine phosphate pyrophosphorylase [uncultured euryarchaeote Alv-FOS1]